MSFQAYLDNIEEKTGKTPSEFVALAAEKGFGPETKAGHARSSGVARMLSWRQHRGARR